MVTTEQTLSINEQAQSVFDRFAPNHGAIKEGLVELARVNADVQESFLSIGAEAYLKVLITNARHSVVASMMSENQENTMVANPDKTDGLKILGQVNKVSILDKWQLRDGDGNYVALGDATKTVLMRNADTHLKLAETNSIRGRWLALIAKNISSDTQRVREAFTNSDVNAFYFQAIDSLGKIAD